MYICKWCGREFEERRMKGAGGWAVCSESCRKQLSASVISGDTEKFSRTYKTPYLIAAVLVLVAYSTFFKGCESMAANEPDATSMPALASEETAVVEESSTPETQPAARSVDEPQHAVGTFGEPGQFESTSTEPASEGEIQTIPAPESDSSRKASETAF